MALMTWDAITAARTVETGEATPGTSRDAFLRGLVTNLLNAKAMAFFATVPPRFLRAGAAAGAGLGLLMSGYVLASVLVHAAIVLLASRLGAGASRSRMAWVAATGLGLVTLWLAWRAATST
jgi:threonine/homoserine/homoserine lactone efflux protein